MWNKKFISLVLTRQCNSRCSYCKIAFENLFINEKNINFLLKNISDNQEAEYNIEFFWWEPLLAYNSILYFLKNANFRNLSWYSIVTNWILLDLKKISVLNQYNFKVYISLHPVLFEKFIKKDVFFIKQIKNLEFNLILEPWKIIYANKYLDFLIEKSIINCVVNILPVHYTVSWDKDNLIALSIFLKKLEKYKKYYRFSYFNDFFKRVNDLSLYDIKKWEEEYIVDVDWRVFIDYESEFYLMKDFLPKKILNYKEFYVWNIWNNDFIFQGNEHISFSENMKRILEFQKIKNNMILLSKIIEKYQIKYE